MANLTFFSPKTNFKLIISFVDPVKFLLFLKSQIQKAFQLIYIMSTFKTQKQNYGV